MTKQSRAGLTAISTVAAYLLLSRPVPPLSLPVSASAPAPLPVLATNEPPAAAPESMPDAPDRVAAARGRRGEHLARIFAAAGITYPARGVYLRVFKAEGELELWARADPDNAPFRLVATYPAPCASGRLGPKRREGDRQVPEGFYTVDRFNPRSLFHLSLGLDYPNAADRLLAADPEHPGIDIFIHGAALSAGCLAMDDATAEELYLAASDSRTAGETRPAVHLFPCRMTATNWNRLLAPLCVGRPALETLWCALRKGYEAFERTRQIPSVLVNVEGDYRLE